MSKFKKGDFVTPTICKDFNVGDDLYCIDYGDMGKVTRVYNNEVTVFFGDFMEATYYENQLEPYTPSDAQLIISLAKLREVLNYELESAMLNNSLRADNVADFTDEIIDRIKQEL